MTYVEQAGFKLLDEFITTAEERGISFIGLDMERPVQELVLNIVRDYANEYLREDKQ